MPELDQKLGDPPEQSEARAWSYYCLQLIFCYPMVSREVYRRGELSAQAERSEQNRDWEV